MTNHLNVSFELIKSFIVLAETKNYREAANQLNIAESTLQERIKNLQKYIGVPLLIAGQFQLTPQGKTFLTQSSQILTHWNKFIEELKKDEQLIIGYISSASQIAVNISNRLNSTKPSLKIKLVELDGKDIIPKLHTHDIHVGLVHDAVLSNNKKENIKSKIIRELNFVIVLPSNHRLATKTDISLRDIQNEKFILPSKDSYLNQLIKKICEEKGGFLPNIFNLESTKMQIILSYIQKSQNLITLLPENAQDFQSEYCNLTFKSIQETVSSLKLVALWSYPSDNIATFLDIALLDLKRFSEIALN